MPYIIAELPNLHGDGPVMDVQLFPGMAVVEVLKQQEEPVPGPVKITAMIDTGATNTVISEGIAEQLGLNPVGEVKISTPSSTNVPCYQYVVQFLLPNNFPFETTVVEAPLKGQHIQCLIGRNVLAHMTFIYMGPKNLFSLHI